jgi:hypothetical protein
MDDDAVSSQPGAGESRLSSGRVGVHGDDPSTNRFGSSRPRAPDGDLGGDPLPEAESRETVEAWEESDAMEGEAPTG